MSTTRERIIEASSTLFMERGYSGSGLKQISEASSAPIGSLYHFFPGGKEELAAETLRSSGAAYQELVESVYDSAPDIVAGVRDCFAAAAAVLRETDYADACPIATVALEVASSDERLRLVTAEVFEAWLVSATTRLRQAGVNAARARELATVLVAALEGGFLLSRAAKDTAAMEAIGRTMVQLVEAALESAAPE
ncbi:MAG TPA: TetR/AcrR family transcriptional regulator [Acidimicrobiales bacterium]|nr:TetR/AcrR family transcriptional regulator [Acidimicrobiales bacterium]